MPSGADRSRQVALTLLFLPRTNAPKAAMPVIRGPIVSPVNSFDSVST
jgi:hypothetical protein